MEYTGLGKKSNKDSGEINPLGVHKNMTGSILEINCEGNRQYVCLPFCWSWPEGWDNFHKTEESRKWGHWFWNSG